MTTSTPLPEQGGFNERLDDAILNLMGCDLNDSEQVKVFREDYSYIEAQKALRTLVLEEIIGRDDPYRKGLSNLAAVDNFVKAQRNQLRAEQRKKLGGSDE